LHLVRFARDHQGDSEDVNQGFVLAGAWLQMGLLLLLLLALVLRHGPR
jgi:hypothetical protein